MATKQRGSLPPVLSTEETRVKPPEEDEEELPSEPPSWDPQRDSTQLLPNSTSRPTWNEGDEATPPVPRKIDPIPLEDPELQGPDEATRPIPRKGGARPATQEPDDSTRQIPRKTGTRPALQEPDDSTRQIPRKTGTRPALQEPDDATRNIPRKTGTRPALQEPGDSTRPIPRKAGSVPPAAREAPRQETPLPWDAGGNDASALPTRAQSLPPIVMGSEQALVSPPHGPPVLVPVNTEPHYIRQAPSVPVIPQPNYAPPPASAPMLTSPNYVPPPPPVLSPVVTAPHLISSLSPPPSEPLPGEEPLRTTFSNKAAMVADLVKSTFARRSYGTAPYRLRIDEPDGPSTAGGLHARQPISLVSNLESVPAIVCGWVDVAKKESQLRSYGVVARRHKSRYTHELDINEAEYEQFLNELVETLFYGGIKIVVQVPDDPEPTQAQGTQAQGAQAQPQRSGGSCLSTLFLLALTFALGIGVGMNTERLAPLIQQVKALIPQH
ncbi:MAG: hypothetical protein ACJ8AT_14860 [Hyalangium sp.]|uniref:hypothetical protein n=1 Tax=Hyalangium sp. TaxID=2028555 RepID=UPI00389997D1